jgi:hypothetical protein
MRPLVERFINLFDPKQKQEYVDVVWDILQKSYQKVGGIHGSGFNSKEDMINSMPFWKIAKKNGRVVAVALYKDKGGRKRVASGTDGTADGLNQLELIGREDLNQERAYAEVSSAALKFLLKRWKGSDITKYMILPQDAEKILGAELEYPVSDQDPEVVAHPQLKKYFYSREIGGKPHTKLMIGKPGQKIT